MRVNGVQLLPDPSGALFWPEQALLVFADLHLEKGSSFAERGVALPPYDTRATLRAMATLCTRYAPRRVVCLGDNFHDMRAWERMDAVDKGALGALVGAHDWIWISGNHDPEPPVGIGGKVQEVFTHGPLTFRHAPTDGSGPGAITGHLHPCARVRVRGRRLRRRCFVTDGVRLILPAFGAYTGGLDVAEPAIADLFPNGFHAWMLGADNVFPVSRARLCRSVYTLKPA